LTQSIKVENLNFCVKGRLRLLYAGFEKNLLGQNFRVGAKILPTSCRWAKNHNYNLKTKERLGLAEENFPRKRFPKTPVLLLYSLTYMLYF
jgi:hypothetical protein